MIEIQLVDIIKSGKVLFKDFTFTIKEHEHWVITGDNGSGKTTLLELLAGSTLLSKGSIHYDFISCLTWDERYRQRRQKIMYVPANAIHTFLNNFELYYQQRYYSIGDQGIPLVEDIFGEDLSQLSLLSFPESFNIKALLKLELTRLSNGQLKKVLILKNLIKQIPRLLLMDYPFEGLDHDSRIDLINFLDHLVEVHKVQLVIVDHHHTLPKAINRKLLLHNFKAVKIETVEYQIKQAELSEAISTNVEASSNESVVEVKNLTIQYGRKKIIDNLNWKISKGERWALIGKNGSGKTTLFSLFFADHPMAYSPQVYLFGKRRGSGESIWDIKNRISYLGPEIMSFLNPKTQNLPAREYIQTLHKDNIDKRLEQLIQFFQIQLLQDTALRHLSSGQLQLILLINYFIRSKELLLLDEPFQFLDPNQKQRVKEYIQHYLNAGTTMVLITHYEEDIVQWTAKTMRL